MPIEVELFYSRCQVLLKSLQASRSYKERTLLGRKFLRRKLETGYLKGVSDSIAILKKIYKKLCKEALKYAKAAENSGT